MEKITGSFIPGQSPLASFLAHPKFWMVAESSNFQLWVDKGMSQFYKLGTGKLIHPYEQIACVIGDPIIRFQIEQIKALVIELRQSYEVFRPLSKLELFLLDVLNRTKTLSSLYKILLSTTSADNRVKRLWERDLGIILTNGITSRNLIFPFQQT